GGVAGDDITQGLPRVEELFEARSPKKPTILADFDGVVSLDESKKTRQLTLKNELTGEEKAYSIPYGMRLLVADGDSVLRGQSFTEGLLKPADILRVNGLDAVYEYIVREIQRVYRLQAVDINDKHVEIIARQMTRKVRVEDEGDTDLLPGSLVDVVEFEDANDKVRASSNEMARLATATPVLQGITKAALSTDSFLSAASFQETTKVLTEAAIKGKVDPLMGLKENVIIGKLIPAGTGLGLYRDMKVDYDGRHAPVDISTLEDVH
ncbi:MAG: DNA-directed RNA polymerase subunit beta', partial [Clostridia bacterium]|nr:DNA-directed RNA polymerase subunit beta' [Clostridia bacterium]